MAASFKERLAWAFALVGSLLTHAVGSDRVLVELEAKQTEMNQVQVESLEAWSKTLWPENFEALTELVCHLDWKARSGSCTGYGVRPYDKDMVPSGGVIVPGE